MVPRRSQPLHFIFVALKGLAEHRGIVAWTKSHLASHRSIPKTTAFPNRRKRSQFAIRHGFALQCGRLELNQHDLLRSLGPEPSASANSATSA